MFINYLASKIKTIAAFAVFLAVYAAFDVLCHLPAFAIVYPIILCVILGAAFLVLGFFRQRKKYETITKTRSAEAMSVDSLPKPDGLAEKGYFELVEILKETTETLETNKNSRYRDMTEYYTVWVHQIKTPIASMKLSLQNEDSSLSRRIKSDLFRVEQYVEMVLTFLRLDSDSTDFVFREHSVDEIVRGAIKKFASEFILRKIRLEYDQIEETVITDDKWMSFIIEQIISNSLKYTNEGSIRIYMQEPKTLCICDTGIGIAPGDLPRIFEKGFTGFNGRSDKTASGIGLYLCKRISSRLGTKISVQSEPGKGTTIMLDLSQYRVNDEILTEM